MIPHYVTINSTSANSSPWQGIDTNRNPVNISLVLNASAAIIGTAQIDYCIDNPFAFSVPGTFNPALNPSGAITSTGYVVNIFQSSQAGGAGITTITSATTFPVTGIITSPVTAIRVTASGSAGGSPNITLTWLQSGPR